MKFSNQQAEKLARQILERFYYRIRSACSGSSVNADFMAAFCAIEAGKDKKTGRISETATRFEPGVFAKLKAVRDGVRRSWSKITTADLRGATDAALEALATSYGLTQIMGWHAIHSLKCLVGDIKNPQKHLSLAVQLLELVASEYLENNRFENVLRIWNTGKPNGKTHDPDYVYNALLVMEKITELRNQSPELVVVPKDEPAINSKTEPTPVAPILAPSPEPEPGNASSGQIPTDPATEQTTTATTTAGGKTETIQTATIKNEQDVTTPAIVAEPKPQGFIKKLGASIVALLSGSFFFEIIGKISGAGVSLTWQITALVGFIILLGFVGLIVWYVVDAWKQTQRVKIQAQANSDTTKKDLIFAPHDFKPGDLLEAFATPATVVETGNTAQTPQFLSGYTERRLNPRSPGFLSHFKRGNQ